jgi:hypothetical protein
VLGIEVADGQLDGIVVPVEVQAIDPEHRLADFAIQVTGGERRSSGCTDALLCGHDFVVAAAHTATILDSGEVVQPEMEVDGSLRSAVQALYFGASQASPAS